jgi:hypothetical protein
LWHYTINLLPPHRSAIAASRLSSSDGGSRNGLPFQGCCYPAIGPGGRRRHDRFPPVSFGLGGEASA